MNRRLVAVDESLVVADYEADVTVKTICETHEIALVRLYEILDRHRVPLRRPNAPKLPARLVRRILAEYEAGIDVAAIAKEHGVSTSSVSKVAQRHSISRVPKYTRDQLIELVVRHLAGEDLNHAHAEAVGASAATPGWQGSARSSCSTRRSSTTSRSGWPKGCGPTKLDASRPERRPPTPRELHQDRGH